jgi:hypothetical protein
MCDNSAVPELSQRGLPTWAVILTAIVAPIMFAVLFIATLDAAHLSDAEWRADPNAGYTQAYVDEGVLFLYGVVQVAFLIVAPWTITRRPGLRTAFLAIAVPLCLLFSLIAVISQIAG